VEKDGKLAIEFTKDAQNPLAAGTGKPLVTYDVWVRAPARMSASYTRVNSHGTKLHAPSSVEL